MAESIQYPATYRAPIISRIFSVSSVASLVILGFLGRAHLDQSSSKSIWMFASVLFIAAVLYFLSESSSYIVLSSDKIEKKSWLGTKTWRRDEVAGLWFNKSGDFRLVRKHNKGDYFIIPAGIKRDTTWNNWLRDVPDTEIKSLHFRFSSKTKSSR